MAHRQFREFELVQYEKSTERSKRRETLGVPLPNQTIISLYVDHILYEEFYNLITLMKQLFFEETNVEVKMHVLDKVHQYYK